MVFPLAAQNIVVYNVARTTITVVALTDRAKFVMEQSAQ